MKKMPCLFVREFHGRQEFTITDAVTPGCEWVLAGEGNASVKRDGTACMVRDGQLFKRYDAKRDRKTGEYKAPPAGAIPCSDPDPETGHWPHWVPVDAANPADKWHVAAYVAPLAPLADGTYELCGPHFQANPEELDEERFFRHGDEAIDPPRTFDELRLYLEKFPHEGIVFAHTDGRMAKIRRNDFGLEWP